MCTVGIVDPAVARTHEEVRLREPSHRTTEMRTINREDLEGRSVQVPYPARNIGCLAIPWIDVWIPIYRQPGLALWKLLQRAHRKPILIARLPSAS
jgi:hypothetical protein